MFELYTSLFLVSFGSVDYSKGNPLGTIIFRQIHWHKLRGRWLSHLRVIALCLRRCEKANLSMYAFSVLICLYLYAGLRVKLDNHPTCVLQ